MTGTPMMLGGATMSITGSMDQITGIIVALHTCSEHQGCHHFAVVGEGREVRLSKGGVACLQNQGVALGPEPHDDLPATSTSRLTREQATHARESIRKAGLKAQPLRGPGEAKPG